MSFRTLVINSPSKLDFKNNKMVIRCLLEDKRREIFLEELEVLILEEQRITITNVLLKELLNNNIKMIVCDEKHNPIGEMYPYAVKFDASAQIHKQVQWANENKRRVWKLIIQEKIRQQRLLLEHLKTDKTELLLDYENGVVDGDDTGRIKNHVI